MPQDIKVLGSTAYSIAEVDTVSTTRNIAAMRASNNAETKSTTVVCDQVAMEALVFAKDYTSTNKRAYSVVKPAEIASKVEVVGNGDFSETRQTQAEFSNKVTIGTTSEIAFQENLGSEINTSTLDTANGYSATVNHTAQSITGSVTDGSVSSETKSVANIITAKVSIPDVTHKMVIEPGEETTGSGLFADDVTNDAHAKVYYNTGIVDSRVSKTTAGVTEEGKVVISQNQINVDSTSGDISSNINVDLTGITSSASDGTNTSNETFSPVQILSRSEEIGGAYSFSNISSTSATLVSSLDDFSCEIASTTDGAITSVTDGTKTVTDTITPTSDILFIVDNELHQNSGHELRASNINRFINDDETGGSASENMNAEYVERAITSVNGDSAIERSTPTEVKTEVTDGTSTSTETITPTHIVNQSAGSNDPGVFPDTIVRLLLDPLGNFTGESSGLKVSYDGTTTSSEVSVTADNLILDSRNATDIHTNTFSSTGSVEVANDATNTTERKQLATSVEYMATDGANTSTEQITPTTCNVAITDGTLFSNANKSLSELYDTLGDDLGNTSERILSKNIHSVSISSGAGTSTVAQTPTDITITADEINLVGSLNFIKYGATLVVMNGTDTVFTIPHGMGSVPTSFAVTFGDASNTNFTQSGRTIDATNITLTCITPPLLGSQTVYWQVFK